MSKVDPQTGLRMYRFYNPKMEYEDEHGNKKIAGSLVNKQVKLHKNSKYPCGSGRRFGKCHKKK